MYAGMAWPTLYLIMKSRRAPHQKYLEHSIAFSRLLSHALIENFHLKTTAIAVKIR